MRKYFVVGDRFDYLSFGPVVVERIELKHICSKPVLFYILQGKASTHAVAAKHLEKLYAVQAG